MNIAAFHSHLNGEECLLVRHVDAWKEVQAVIEDVDAEVCRTKISAESRTKGRVFYSPVALNREFKRRLNERGWTESRTDYWVTDDERLARASMTLSPQQQRQAIEVKGKKPIHSFNQTDFVKDRLAIEVQFGKYSFVAFDLFVKHMAFFVADKIDVGIEILPVKALSDHMSSGVAYYERELYNVVRQGRGVPAVPLVLIGVAP